MNNQKGFTMIELLATLVIIAIISTLTITAFSSYIKTTKEQKLKINENSIQEASILYVKEYREVLEKNNTTNAYCITVEELIQKGYLKENILDNQIKKNSYIKVYKNEDNLTYETSSLITSNDKYNQECITQ